MTKGTQHRLIVADEDDGNKVLLPHEEGHLVHGLVVDVVLSLSVIVSVALLCAPKIAPVALLSVKLAVSSNSAKPSSMTSTVNVWLASPSAKVSVPRAVIKSERSEAVPLVVAKSTCAAPEVLPVRVTVMIALPAPSDTGATAKRGAGFS